MQKWMVCTMVVFLGACSKNDSGGGGVAASSSKIVKIQTALQAVSGLTDAPQKTTGLFFQAPLTELAANSQQPTEQQKMAQSMQMKLQEKLKNCSPSLVRDEKSRTTTASNGAVVPFTFTTGPGCPLQMTMKLSENGLPDHQQGQLVNKLKVSLRLEVKDPELVQELELIRASGDVEVQLITGTKSGSGEFTTGISMDMKQTGTVLAQTPADGAYESRSTMEMLVKSSQLEKGYIKDEISLNNVKSVYEAQVSPQAEKYTINGSAVTAEQFQNQYVFTATVKP